MTNQNFERRMILGLAAGVAAMTVNEVVAQTPADGTPGWKPAMEAQDNWLSQNNARHRLVFDTTTTTGAGHALGWAANFLNTSKSAYGLSFDQSAVVIIFRHISTPFGFNDTAWAKYGDVFSKRMELTDPRSKAPPKVNLYQADVHDDAIANGGTTIASLVEKGVRFAVCATATHNNANMIAKLTGEQAADVEAMLKANLVPGAMIVPAGIVAVSRAQEHGYTLASTV